MNRYIGFLQGINVGGRRVKMDGLRDLFRALDLADVATFIASGNVIFNTTESDIPAIEARIEAHLALTLGFAVPTFLRTPADLTTIVAGCPFATTDPEPTGRTLHIAFYRDPLGADVAQRFGSFRTAMDDFHVEGRELYWLCRGKVTDSLISWQRVGKAVPLPSTMRNMTTIRKLATMYPAR